MILPAGALWGSTPSGSVHAAPASGASLGTGPSVPAYRPIPPAGPAPTYLAPLPAWESAEIGRAHLPANPQLRAHPAAAPGQGAFVMTNRTLVPGNPTPWDLALPLALSYNPANRSVFVAGGLSDSVGEYLPGSGARLGGAYIGPAPTSITPYGDQLTAFEYDPASRLAVAAPGEGSYLVAWSPTNASVSGFFISPTSIPLFDALTYDPATGILYAADAIDGWVWAINASTWSAVTEIPVGSIPDALLLDGPANRLYVADYGTGNVSVVNTSSQALVRNFSVGGGPVALALDAARSTLWALDAANSRVVGVNLSSGTVGSPVVLPSGSAQAAGLVLDPATSRLLVLNAPSGEITGIDVTRTSTDTSWRLGGVPYRGVIDPALGELVVADAARNLLEVVNLTTGADLHATLLGSAPIASVVDPATRTLWVADAAADAVVEIDSATGGYLGSVAVPASPIDLVLDPATDVIAVVEFANQVTFLNGSDGAQVATWGTGNASVLLGGAYGNGVYAFPAAAPPGVFASYDGSRDLYMVSAADYYEVRDLVVPGVNTVVYASSTHNFYATSYSNSLTVVSSSTYALSYVFLPTGGSMGLAFDNRTNSLYIGWIGGFVNGNFQGNVSAYDLSTSTLGAPATAGSWPQSIVYDPGTRGVYVSDSSNDSVYEILDTAPTTVSRAFTVGDAPIGLSSSVATGLLYVPNSQSSTVSLIPLAAASTPLTVTIALTPPTDVVGRNVSIAVTPSYPAWGDTVTFGGLPPGCASANTTLLVCRPTAPGNFTVFANVTTPVGSHAGASAPLRVVSPLGISGLRLDPSALDVGRPIRIVLSVQGGLAPVNVSYPVLPAGCADTHGTNWSCTPSARGNFSVEAVVSDPLGEVAFANASGVANAPPEITDVLLTPSTPSAGRPLSLLPVVSGGTAPFVFHYLGLPPGCLGSTAANVSCTPSQPGNFSVEIDVTDADGLTATRTTTLSIAPAAPTTGASGGLPTLDILLLVAVIVVVAVVAAALLLRRRPGAAPRTPGSEGPEPESGLSPAPVDEGPAPAVSWSPVAAAPAAPPPSPGAGPGVGAAPEGSEVEGPVYEAGPEFEMPAPTTTPSGPARAPLVCPSCGAANDPWLTVCRQCRRPLHATG